MRYMVKWTENHNYLVAADSKEKAIELAQRESPSETFYDYGEPTAEIVITERYFEVTWRENVSRQVMAKTPNEALNKAVLEACENPGGMTRTFDDQFSMEVKEVHKS